MNKLLITLLSFTTLYSFGQTEIQESEFKLSHSFNCLSYQYDITTPLLYSRDTADLRYKANDSIAAIARYFQKEIGYPYFMNPGDCPQIYQGTEQFSIDYQVGLNTDSFLSIVINTNHSNGNGGHGGESYSYCFNIDLVQNKSITFDSLVSPANKSHLCKYIKEHYDMLSKTSTLFENIDYFSPTDCNYVFDTFESGSIRYIGAALDSTNLTIYYSVYLGSAYNTVKDIRLPLASIKQFINKKYWWLCRPTKPAKK